MKCSIQPWKSGVCQTALHGLLIVFGRGRYVFCKVLDLAGTVIAETSLTPRLQIIVSTCVIYQIRQESESSIPYLEFYFPGLVLRVRSHVHWWIL